MIINKVKTSSSSLTSKASVFNYEKKVIDKVKLDNKFWKVEINPQIVHDVLVSQQASERLSTKKTKTKGEVSGGGKKPWKQKGTGRARHGSIRSPIWRGGGVVFGPTSKENYLKKVNRKTYRKAICMILSDALTSEKIFFWKDQDLTKPATKTVLEILNFFKFQDKKVLFIAPDNYQNLVLSTNNLPKVQTISVTNVNPYYLLNADKILVYSPILTNLEKRLVYF